MAKSEGGVVYKHPYGKSVYEYMPNGTVREFATWDEFLAAGYTDADIQTKEAEVYKLPNDATVYEYHPETQTSVPIPDPQSYLNAYGDWGKVQTWTPQQLEDTVTTDMIVEDSATADQDFETWYANYRDEDELKARSLAKEHLKTEEERLTQDFGIYRTRAEEARDRTTSQIDTNKANMLRDKLASLKDIERSRGITLRSFYDETGAAGMSRSGIRQRKEGNINEEYKSQTDRLSNNYNDNLSSLDEMRQNALRQYGEQYGETGTSQLAYNRGIADTATARNEFEQDQLDKLKAMRRPSFTSERNMRSNLGI